MAGNYYSLVEAAEKLGFSAEQVHQLVEDGKLTVFPQGSESYFSVEEVDTLSQEIGDSAKGPENEILSDDAMSVVSEEQAGESDLSFESGVTLPTQEPDAAQASEEPEVSEGMEVPEAEPVVEEAGETGQAEVGEVSGEGEEATAEISDISLASTFSGAEPKVTNDDTFDIDFSGGDTAVGQEGVNVLGEEGFEDFSMTEDSMGETKAMGEAASLEEIEDSVNLDTFGSGSGLLDLSLQADDTSLGGILDEIYTPEGEEDAVPAEGSAMEVAAEADMLSGKGSMESGEPLAVSVAAMRGYVELPPDKSSNIFGWLLILPIAAVIYSLVVVMSFAFGARPGIFEPIKDYITYGFGGLLVVALVWAVAGAFSGGSGKVNKAKTAKSPKAKKEKKKKEKKPKVKKEKKSKKKKK